MTMMGEDDARHAHEEMLRRISQGHVARSVVERMDDVRDPLGATYALLSNLITAEVPDEAKLWHDDKTVREAFEAAIRELVIIAVTRALAETGG